MKRRRFLTATGLGVLGGLAGCTDGRSSGEPTTRTRTLPGLETDSEDVEAPFEHAGTIDETLATNGDYPPDDDPADGRPPAFPDPPAAPDVDGSAFDTTEVNDESVRLAPIDVVYAWYRRGEARFVDARGLDQYVRAHVYGSVLSTAQHGSMGGGIEGWGADDRIVTYCGCPHHLSTMRAAGLQKAGFTNVFSIDEGVRPWYERDYPMAGTHFAEDSEGTRASWTIRGSVSSDYAGRYVHAAADRQYEAAPIRRDGSYELTLHFWDVTAETPIELSTPADTVTRQLGELGSRVS